MFAGINILDRECGISDGAGIHQMRKADADTGIHRHRVVRLRSGGRHLQDVVILSQNQYRRHTVGGQGGYGQCSDAFIGEGSITSMVVGMPALTGMMVNSLMLRSGHR